MGYNAAYNTACNVAMWKAGVGEEAAQVICSSSYQVDHDDVLAGRMLLTHKLDPEGRAPRAKTSDISWPWQVIYPPSRLKMQPLGLVCASVCGCASVCALSGVAFGLPL